ncbi:hypothetical protein ACF09H_17750 [Streptomyces sp. NPDC014983]|uniref:hypothetical protein n=1 Tax=Streptomyces sp. NPDC014983 TaxID=3364933 RepID=UPI0036FB2B7D
MHSAGHPDPRALSLVDRAENCGSDTRDRWAAQGRLPEAAVSAEDDGAVPSMVADALGMAVIPAPHRGAAAVPRRRLRHDTGTGPVPWAP